MPPSAADPDLRVEEITTGAGLRALRPEWAALWWGDPAATPFQSHEWVCAWWAHFVGEDGSGLCVVSVRRVENGELVAVVPLLVYDDHAAGGERRAVLLGTGISDGGDGLFAPGFESAGAGAALGCLARERTRIGWEVLDFQQLREGSPLRRAAAPPGVREEAAGWQEPSLVLSFPPGARSAADFLPARLLANLRYARRAAERQHGPVTVETAAEGNFTELFDALLRLHGARWGARSQSGVLADAAVRAFHREAAAGLLRAGALRLHALRFGGQIVASLYAFARGDGRTWYYLGGFDPGFARLSPGGLLLLHAVEAALNEPGAREFDFLRGAEPYKLRWGARERPNFFRRLRGNDE